MIPTKLSDALDISGHWTSELHMSELFEGQLRVSGLLTDNSTLDVVAIGKASNEMMTCLHSLLGTRIARHLVVGPDDAGRSTPLVYSNRVVGDHPVPGTRSLAASTRLLEFLDSPTTADMTLFLVSGGASSLCARPAAPLALEDLSDLWLAALEAGIDITALNQLRAATSTIAGGAVLRSVRTPLCHAFIMVDNVISGAPWVASGLTYEYQPLRDDVATLVDLLNRSGSVLEERLLLANDQRSLVMERPVSTSITNTVLAEPSLLLECARTRALELGYRIVDMRDTIQGDVVDVVEEWRDVLRKNSKVGDRVALLGVGEVTVRVLGSGRGGRCQEFAWRMADVLQDISRPAVFVARASDGRDFEPGVAGAWVDESTVQLAARQQLDWQAVVANNDSFTALNRLGQIIEGSPTGWNLCDLYVALL